MRTTILLAVAFLLQSSFVFCNTLKDEGLVGGPYCALDCVVLSNVPSTFGADSAVSDFRTPDLFVKVFSLLNANWPNQGSNPWHTGGWWLANPKIVGIPLPLKFEGHLTRDPVVTSTNGYYVTDYAQDFLGNGYFNATKLSSGTLQVCFRWEATANSIPLKIVPTIIVTKYHSSVVAKAYLTYASMKGFVANITSYDCDS